MSTSRTRPPVLLAAVGLLAVIAAGCGASDTASGSDDVETAVPPAAGACLEGAEDCQDTGDMGAPQPDPGEATEVEATEGLDDIRAVGWDSIDVDPADQTQVTLYWWSGVAPCNALADVEVDYSDEAVSLTVLEGSVPADEPQACIDLAQYKSTTITLDEEIGPRSILDGAEA